MASTASCFPASWAVLEGACVATGSIDLCCSLSAAWRCYLRCEGVHPGQLLVGRAGVLKALGPAPSVRLSLSISDIRYRTLHAILAHASDTSLAARASPQQVNIKISATVAMDSQAPWASR